MYNAMRLRFTKTQDDLIVKIVLESGLPLIRSSFKMAFWKDHMTNFPSRDALAVQRRLNLLWARPDVQGKLTSRTEDITESEKNRVLECVRQAGLPSGWRNYNVPFWRAQGYKPTEIRRTMRIFLELWNDKTMFTKMFEKKNESLHNLELLSDQAAFISEQMKEYVAAEPQCVGTFDPNDVLSSSSGWECSTPKRKRDELYTVSKISDFDRLPPGTRKIIFCPGETNLDELTTGLKNWFKKQKVTGTKQ